MLWCVFSEYTIYIYIVYEHNRVDKIRVDSIHGSVCTCRHFACGIRALRLIYMLTLSLVKAVHAIAAMFDDRTKNPKDQVEHCLISARKIYSLRR